MVPAATIDFDQPLARDLVRDEDVAALGVLRWGDTLVLLNPCQRPIAGKPLILT